MKGSIGWFLLIGFLLLAACSGPAQPAVEGEGTESAATEPAVTAASPAPVETEPAEATATRELTAPGEVDETTQPAEPTEEPTEMPAPTPRTELQATNPREVNLASGELQFVEFFAYW
jgi:outer membrane biosynthesis protein TonB